MAQFLISTVVHFLVDNRNYSTGLTEAQAKALLFNDLQIFVNAVNEETQGIELQQQQFDALVSFAYNIGIGDNGFKGSSLLANIKNGSAMTKDNFTAWSMCNGSRLLGLWRRRVDEWQMFTQGDYTRDYPNW